MKEKLLGFRKRAVVLLSAALAMMAFAVPVFATESSGGMASVETALTSSFTEVGSSMTGMIGKILPIALPIIGAMIIIPFAIKLFKKVTNK